MVPKFARYDSSEAVARMEAAARRSAAAQSSSAHEMKACADMFLHGRSEDTRLARGRRLIAQACRKEFGDAALKRHVVGVSVDALQMQSPKFKQAWETLTRPQGPYGLPESVTVAHVARQPEIWRHTVCTSRMQQWERDFRLELATSGVLVRLVLLQAARLPKAHLDALAAYAPGLQRSVAHTLLDVAQPKAAAQAAVIAATGATLAPLRAAECARWQALIDLDRLQQRQARGQNSQIVSALQAVCTHVEVPRFILTVRALIAAFAGVDVAACAAFYRSAVGQVWLDKQTELSYTELEKLWAAIDRHTQRIDSWIRTLA